MKSTLRLPSPTETLASPKWVSLIQWLVPLFRHDITNWKRISAAFILINVLCFTSGGVRLMSSLALNFFLFVKFAGGNGCAGVTPWYSAIPNLMWHQSKLSYHQVHNTGSSLMHFGECDLDSASASSGTSRLHDEAYSYRFACWQLIQVSVCFICNT